jgi:hypothetical protein
MKFEWQKENLQTFVLHDTRGTDRRVFMERQLSELGISAEWVTGFSPSDVADEVLRLNADWDLIPHTRVRSATGSGDGTINTRKITPADGSLICKHRYCWQVSVQNDCPVMIFEDDAELPSFFPDLLNLTFSELDHDYKHFLVDDVGIVMLGGSLSSYPRSHRTGHVLHYASNQKTRTTHAYMVCPSAARGLLDGFTKFWHSIDIQMNAIIEIKNIGVGWSWPCVTQKSNFKSYLYEGR